MSWASAGRIGLFGVLLWANGCTTPRTELVVNVITDMPAGTLQSLHIDVRRGNSSGVLRVSRYQSLRSTPLPLSFGLLPEDDDTRTPLWIEVLGCMAGDTCAMGSMVVTQRVVISFVPNKTFEVDVPLTVACRNVRCPTDQRCNAFTGVCVAARLEGRELVGDQASPPRLDAAAPRG